MKLNGQIHEYEKDITLSVFLQQKKYDLSRIAVELNGEIAPKEVYETIILKEEDCLEVVSFVGGG